MKKTLAALIVSAFAASAANAAVVYDNEGTKVELNGVSFVGKIDEMAPVIKIVKISNTTNSITVEVATKRNEGRKLEYYIKNEDEEEYKLIETSNEESYTYEGLEQGKKYNVKSARQIRQWIHNYNEFGEEGLKRSRQKNNYSFEFKLHMVESYLSNEVSYEELALANGITNYTMISRWVEAFRVAGPDGLRPRKKGRKKTLDNSVCNKISQNVKENTPNTSAEHMKELEDELLKLRIENAFLKELRRLRLEDDAKMRERLESSVVSEDNSN